jgi:hypothetical protein
LALVVIPLPHHSLCAGFVRVVGAAASFTHKMNELKVTFAWLALLMMI